MSLILDGEGTTPGLQFKTWGFGHEETVSLTVRGKRGDISMKDFLIAVHYVLTNTDLSEDDVRLKFVDSVRAMRTVPGWSSPANQRLETHVSPV